MRGNYLETSIVSYLAAQPSRDLIVAARQQITHDWWTSRRGEFELFVSELVHVECAAGDPDAARRRAAYVDQLPTLAITRTAEDLAAKIMRGTGLPRRAQADALHIAVAATQGVDF